MLSRPYACPEPEYNRLLCAPRQYGSRSLTTVLSAVVRRAEERRNSEINSPTMPTQIILCPQSCGPLQMTPNSGVSILYGCPSVPPA